MKKAFTILISVLFLASGLRVSIDRHYCGGSLSETKISLTGARASCGMETAGDNWSRQLVYDSGCCEDQMSSFTLSNNFFPESFQIEKPFPSRQVMIFQSVILSENGFLNNGYFNIIFPPWVKQQDRLTQPDICVFRI
jgi:hypothetical protein